MRQRQVYAVEQHQAALAAALNLLANGEQVRVAIANNGGFHSYAAFFCVNSGPHIRHPMVEEQIREICSEQVMRQEVDRAVRLFRAARG